MSGELEGFARILTEYGGWGAAVFLGLAYVLEKRDNNANKKVERDRLLEEVKYLQRVKQSGDV